MEIFQILVEIFQILLVLLLLSQPSSSARRLRQEPPASEFPPPLPGDLPSPHQPPPPPPSPSPQCTLKLETNIVYFRCSPPLGPPSTPHPARAPAQPPSPVGPAQTSYLYCSPPPPITIPPPESLFPLLPPPAPKFSSLALSPFIVRTLSVVLGSVLSALLVAGTVRCITILIRRWAAPNHPVLGPTQGVHVEMQEVPVEMEMQLEM